MDSDQQVVTKELSHTRELLGAVEEDLCDEGVLLEGGRQLLILGLGFS